MNVSVARGANFAGHHAGYSLKHQPNDVGASPVAVCEVEGRDLGELQVLAGMARDCAAFSQGWYAKAERTAFENGKNFRDVYRRSKYCK